MNCHPLASRRSAQRRTRSPIRLAALLAAVSAGALWSTPGGLAPAFAQNGMPAPAPIDAPAPSGPAPARSTPGRPAPPSSAAQERAAKLIDEAMTVAYRNPEARPALARGAAALIPKLGGRARQDLTQRWVALISTGAVSRGATLAAMSAFFDVASQNASGDDLDFGRDVALMLPDPVARTGAFLQLSEAAEKTGWDQAAEWASLAQRAARQETDTRLRARALAYVATRMASLNPVTREAATLEAASQVRLVERDSTRDSLMAEVVGAAAKFDIGLAQRMAEKIENPNLKNLATARIATAQLQSSFAVKKPDAERVAQIVKGVPRYDTSFIPVLLQLPASPEVFQALGDSLPMIYPDAPLSVGGNTLERIWNFSSKAEPSAYRDQLQSRVARLMVLHDLWRGREWGRQLSWDGGREQIARFVDETVRARQSDLQSDELRARTVANVNQAVYSTRILTPTQRVESLLLIAGQVLA